MRATEKTRMLWLNIKICSHLPEHQGPEDSHCPGMQNVRPEEIQTSQIVLEIKCSERVEMC